MNSVLVAANLLLPALVAGPLLAAAILPLLKPRLAQDGFVVAVVGLTLLGVILLAPAVLAGETPTGALPGMLGRFNFALDPFGHVFALVGSFVWFSATLYATAYTREDPARVRFLATLLVLLGASMGVVLAADLLTLFVFFELLGLVALLVVVHSGSDEARAAGIKYFWMTFGGGLALLAGILLVLLQSDSLAWAPLPETVASGWRWAIFGLLLVGFGVKAGMVPLHVWLPAAHPVAPAPASALLSGVMIKAGAYGLFRSLNMLLRPETGAETWGDSVDMGLVLAVLGIVTLLVGVVMALLQNSIKRMLAWSSVSQMGFILTGLGAGAMLAADGAMATAGGLLHVVNHALFKSCLFLAAGAIALRCGTAEMDRLGGLWRQMPLTFACVLVAAAGIAGVPLFNGFVSKSMIHHGLVDAAQLPGGQILVYGEWLFMAAAAGTIAYFSKFIFLVFIRPAPSSDRQPVVEASPAMLAGMLLPLPAILWLGLAPHGVLQGLLAPGLSDWAVQAAPIGYYLERYFFSAADLVSFLILLAGGLALFAMGLKTGWFERRATAGERVKRPALAQTRLAELARRPPDALGVDYWYQRLARWLMDLCLWLSALAAALRKAVPAGIRRLHASTLQTLWDSIPALRRRIWHGLLVCLHGLADFFLKGGMLRRQMWREMMLRLRAAAEFLIDTTLRDHLGTERTPADSAQLEQDRLFAALDRQRDRLILTADRLARERDDARRNDALINASHMLAGWIGTELLERAMASGNQRARELAESEALCQDLAARAVQLARRQLGGKLAASDLDEIAEKLNEQLGTRGKRKESGWPERSWPAEITALALAPDRGHWPVSESLEQGAFVSAARGRIMKVARDLSSGLLVAFLVLLLIAVGVQFALWR